MSKINDSQNNQNNNTESITIKLASLEKEYQILLEQYEVAQNNYIANLNSSDTNNDFVSLQSRTFWGTYGLKEGKTTNESDCKSMCLSDTKCTGATYNPAKQYCWTRGGESSVTVGQSDDYALIPQLRQNVVELSSLNERLLDINKQITQLLNQLYPIAKSEVEMKNQKQKELDKYYGHLLKEQIEIEMAMQKYQTAEHKLANGQLNTVRQDFILRFWIFIFLFLVAIIVLEFMGIGTLGSIGSIIFSMIVVVSALFLMTGFRGTAGFTWFMICVFVVYLLILFR